VEVLRPVLRGQLQVLLERVRHPELEGLVPLAGVVAEPVLDCFLINLYIKVERRPSRLDHKAGTIPGKLPETLSFKFTPLEWVYLTCMCHHDVWIFAFEGCLQAADAMAESLLDVVCTCRCIEGTKNGLSQPLRTKLPGLVFVVSDQVRAFYATPRFLILLKFSVSLGLILETWSKAALHS
jgi:hypothetical protein